MVHYTVTVTNSGQTAYTGAALTDSLSGVLDDASYNGDASATAGSVSFASPNLTWTGNLAVGAVATITFSVTVNNPDNGDKLLTSTIDLGDRGQQLPGERHGQPLRKLDSRYWCLGWPSRCRRARRRRHREPRSNTR